MQAKVLPLTQLRSNGVEELKKYVRKQLDPVMVELEGYYVPLDKADEIITWAIEYFAKNQKMKPVRMARKIAEHFKLKHRDHEPDKV